MLGTIPIDSLLPPTKVNKQVKKPLDKVAKSKFSGQPSTLSAEFVEDSSQEGGRESVDPPSDIEEVPKLKSLLSTFTFGGSGGNGVGNTQSKLFKQVQQPTTDRSREEDMPSLSHTNPTESADNILTPHHDDMYLGDPSTMTHISATFPRLSEGPSSSSQIPYSSPMFDKERRNQYVYAPKPIRDKSREISSLQHLVMNNDTGPYLRKCLLLDLADSQPELQQHMLPHQLKPICPQ